MESQIAAKLTPKEREVLLIYRSPRGRSLTQAIRLSVQYALGAGVFVAMALGYDEALFVLPVYFVLLIVLAARLWRGREIAGLMPNIVDKYEETLKELKDSQSLRAGGGEESAR